MLIESEKLLERKLNHLVKQRGGWSIKLLSLHVTGLPDRVCLMPGGRVFFAEIKTTNKNPTKIQLLVHRKIEALGFKVLIIKRTEDIKQIEL